MRVIQEREIDRVGGTRPIKVDIRLIATSNRDLEDCVRKGTFREDLFFRLNVVTIQVPPLRERPLDIEVLAKHFAVKYAESNGVPARAISEAALAKLTNHPWRGNVRELENAIHRAVLLGDGDGDEIGPDAVMLSFNEDRAETGNGTASAANGAAKIGANGSGQFVGQTVAEVERDLIVHTLSHCLGNRTHAANILGISIRTLRNKLKQYSEKGIKFPMPGKMDEAAL